MNNPNNNFENQLKDAEEMAASQEDPRVLAIVEEVLERVRTILDLFEGIIHEVYNLAQIIADLFREIRGLFSLKKVEEEDADYEPVA